MGELSLLIAPLVAALLHLLLGVFWYAEPVFGRLWQVHSGIKISSKNRQTYFGRAMALTFVAAFVAAYVLNALVHIIEPLSYRGLIALSIVLWAGFSAPALLTGVIWEQKSWVYFSLQAGYWLFSFMMMSVVVSIL